MDDPCNNMCQYTVIYHYELNKKQNCYTINVQYEILHVQKKIEETYRAQTLNIGNHLNDWMVNIHVQDAIS